MIKGCSKRVVVVKDIDSKLFEEAFFIVKPENAKKYAEADYLGEAGRLATISAAGNEGQGSFPSKNAARFSVFPGRGSRERAVGYPTAIGKSARRREVFAFFCGVGVSGVLFALSCLLEIVP